MYDAKNEANEFVGETREEAVTKACRFFVKDEDELNVFSVSKLFQCQTAAVGSLSSAAVAMKAPSRETSIAATEPGCGSSVLRFSPVSTFQKWTDRSPAQLTKVL